MKVLKFGGTSLGSFEMINNSAKIVVGEKLKGEEIVVVVSAMSGVTNSLIKLCDLAENGKLNEVLFGIEELKNKHEDIATKIGCNESICLLHVNIIKHNLNILSDIFKGVSLLGSLTSKDKAKILYFGEILSSILLSLAINKLGVKSSFYKSTEIIAGNGDFINADYNLSLSEIKAKAFLLEHDFSDEIPVITGFGGGDLDGNIYLFDRGGSDYVATIVGSLFYAKSVEIWTDVDGVMSADPKIVSNPIIWDELDYSVSAEFALTGAKILHPKTISPVQEKGIPIYIRNTFNPDFKGTKICKVKDLNGIKGINVDNKQILITFIDNSMLCGVGYIYDVAKIFKNNHISIDTIATSETSFTVSIKERNLSDAFLEQLNYLKENFSINFNNDVTKISIVGDNINNYSILSELTEIKLISQSEFNKTLTIFVKKVDKDMILNKLHKAIFGV